MGMVKPMYFHNSKLIQSVCRCFRIVVLFLSIGPRIPLPYAKFKGTRPQRGACHANRSIDRLPGVPLIVIANSQILQAISFLVHSLEAPEGLYVRNSDARSKGLHWQVPFSLTLVPLSLVYGSA